MRANDTVNRCSSDHWIRRDRLVDRLRAGINRALTVVCAPAGYGKTTLLTQFRHSVPLPVCWLSLDEADKALRTFARHLVAAIQHHFPAFGRMTSAYLDEDVNTPLCPRTLGFVLVQDVMFHIPKFFVLVLDDFHLVDEQLEITDLMEVLLLRGPRHCHTIISSHDAPGGLPAIQLVALDTVAGLGKAHLAFNAWEVQELLLCTHNLDLSLAQAEALVAVSGGCIGRIVQATGPNWEEMYRALAEANLRGADSPGHERPASSQPGASGTRLEAGMTGEAELHIDGLVIDRSGRGGS